MDSSTFHMFHDSWDQDICSITNSINFDFFTNQIFIDQNWMFLFVTVDNFHECRDIFIRYSNLHSLSTKYIRRTNQYRISETVGNLFCFFSGKYCISLRTWNIALCKDLVKELSVLCGIYIFCGSSKNRHSHLHQGFC